MQTIYFLLCGFRKHQITVAWETWSYGCLMRMVFSWNCVLLLWKKVRHRKETDFSFICVVLSVIPVMLFRIWCTRRLQPENRYKMCWKTFLYWVMNCYGLYFGESLCFYGYRRNNRTTQVVLFVISSTSWLPSSNSILNELLVYKKYKEILLLLILFGYVMCNEENFLWCVLCLMTWFLLILN